MKGCQNKTHLQRGHGKGIGTDLVGQKDRGRNRSVSIAVGFYDNNDGTLLPVGRGFHLGIIVGEGGQADFVDGPVKCRVHHNALLLGSLRGAPRSYDNAAYGRSKIDCVGGAIVRHGQIVVLDWQWQC